jgi:SAM-dependent methyltransferase
MHSIQQSLNVLKDTYNYNHWVYSLLRPYVGNTVLEVGAGIGNITRFLLSVERIVCLEPESNYAAQLKSLAYHHTNVTIVQSLIEQFDHYQYDFESVVCVNVLEHIQDDALAMRTMRDVLHENGKILLFVPACAWAYGKIDQSLGHCRRYSKGMLKDMALKCEMELSICRYFNFVGLLGWWWTGRILREDKIDPAKARAMDNMVPYISAVEKLIAPLRGQSLFAVFEKQSNRQILYDQAE